MGVVSVDFALSCYRNRRVALFEMCYRLVECRVDCVGNLVVGLSTDNVACNQSLQVINNQSLGNVDVGPSSRDAVLDGIAYKELEQLVVGLEQCEYHVSVLGRAQWFAVAVAVLEGKSLQQAGVEHVDVVA